MHSPRSRRMNAASIPRIGLTGFPLALLANDALAMGYSFTPRENLILIFTLVATGTGLAAGVVTGLLRWRIWKTLPIGSALVLCVLALQFSQKHWSFYAATAVPWLFGLYLASHSLAHLICAHIARRRSRGRD